MFYSKTTNGFYTREIHGDNLPDDSVEITQDYYEELLSGQCKGQCIVANDQGHPVLQQPLFTQYVPNKVSMRQARLALLNQSLLDQVNSTIKSPEAQIEWEYSTTVERDSKFVQEMILKLNMSKEQVDNLFVLANSL